MQKHKYADDHSQREISPIELSLIPWRVIAVKKKPRDHWEITEQCPYQDCDDPLKAVYQSSVEGTLIVATKRIDYRHYELVCRVPNEPWEELEIH